MPPSKKKPRLLLLPIAVTAPPAGSGEARCYLSVAPKARSHTGEPKTERYSVMPKRVDEILDTLGVKPTVDVFADQYNHNFPRWWGAGGENPSAWMQDWGQATERGEILWINPPFTKLAAVVDKLITERARAVLICPNWTTAAWWKRIQPYVKRDRIYQRMPFFDLRDAHTTKRLPSPVWAMWAYWVDCTCEPDETAEPP